MDTAAVQPPGSGGTSIPAPAGSQEGNAEPGETFSDALAALAGVPTAGPGAPVGQSGSKAAGPRPGTRNLELVPVSDPGIPSVVPWVPPALIQTVPPEASPISDGQTGTGTPTT